MRWTLRRGNGRLGEAVEEPVPDGYEVHEWDSPRFVIADGSVVVASATSLEMATRWCDGWLKESSGRRSLAVYELRATITPVVSQTIIRTPPE